MTGELLAAVERLSSYCDGTMPAGSQRNEYVACGQMFADTRMVMRRLPEHLSDIPQTSEMLHKIYSAPETLAKIVALARLHCSPASNPGAHALAAEILRIAGDRK